MKNEDINYYEFVKDELHIIINDEDLGMERFENEDEDISIIIFLSTIFYKKSNFMGSWVMADDIANYNCLTNGVGTFKIRLFISKKMNLDMSISLNNERLASIFKYIIGDRIGDITSYINFIFRDSSILKLNDITAEEFEKFEINWKENISNIRLKELKIIDFEKGENDK